MNHQQKLINFFTLLLLFFFLYYFNNTLTQHHSNQENFIHIAKAIGKGQNIDPDMLKTIQKIVRQPLNYINDSNPTCFFWAYNQIIALEKIDAPHLFTIFQESNQQFDKVANCSHYLALLIFRAQTLEQKTREKVMKELLRMQKTVIKELYPKQGRKSKICIHFNAYNIENTVKHQITLLGNQSYDNFKVTIYDDESTDNTPIFIKYTLDDLKKENLQFFNKKSDLYEMKLFLNECSNESIVVLLSNNQTLLGQNALWIIDRIFSNLNVDIAFLGSFTSPHSNLENINFQQDLTSSYMPFVAFRKKFAFDLDKFNSITDDLQAKEILRRNWFRYLLKQQAQRMQGNIRVINEALVYRSAEQNPEVMVKLEQMKQK